MDILNQLETKISAAVNKINELQNKIDELEKENQEYKDMLQSKLESFDSTLGSVVGNDDLEKNEKEEVGETEPTTSVKTASSEGFGSTSSFTTTGHATY